MEELGDDGKILRVIPITAHTSYVIARTEWNIGCISLKRIFPNIQEIDGREFEYDDDDESYY